MFCQPLKHLTRIALVLVFLFKSAAAQECGKTRDLIDYINKFHIEPRELNDDFSHRIFGSFLDHLDPQKIYFTKEDSVSLSRYAESLDDMILRHSCEFPEEVAILLRRRIERTHRLMDSLLRSPMNYSRKQTGPSIRRIPSLPANYAALREVISGQVTLAVYNHASRICAVNNEDLSVESFLKNESAAREKVRRRLEETRISQLEAINDKPYITAQFWKSICSTYDPHTTFLSSSEGEAFQSALRMTKKSFGIEVTFNRAGVPSISRLHPGGPAWRSNLLKVGDVLMGLKPDDYPEVDFADLDEHEILGVLYDPAVSRAQFRIKKAEGRDVVIALVKEALENTENLISSFVLTGPVKAGYIELPGFYTSLETDPTKGCGEDVAHEIIKLKREGIQALILDLRNNGGGSLKEVLDLAGIFVDYGPLGILDRKAEAPLTLRDQNRGVLYDGPLVILVNQLSASASEFISAALQDYRRALIVGTTTYGKATGQQVMDAPAYLSSGGQLKITTSRIYRITRGSLQRTGVTPDIHLPDISEALDRTEASNPHALFPGSTSKKIYFTPGPELPGEQLRQASRQRIAQLAPFRSIDSLITLLNEPPPLQLNAYLNHHRALSRHLEIIQANPVKIRVQPTAIDQQLHAVDRYHQQISDQAMDEIARSIYLHETLQILDQWINQKR